MTPTRQVTITTFTGLALFIAMAALVSAGLTQVWDRALLLSLREPGDADDPLGPRWFEETAADITALGGYPVIVLAVIFVTVALLILRKRAAALYLVASLAGGSIASTLLKLLFARPRPDVAQHLDQTFTSSFPSAHAMVSTVAWLTLAAIAIRFVKSHNLRMAIVSGAFTIVALVGLTRIYLGVHWPSDVLAGWSVGLAWAGLCWLVADRLASNRATLSAADRSVAHNDLGHSRM